MVKSKPELCKNMDGEGDLPLESMNTGGHANGVRSNGQATENQLNGHANVVHSNGQGTENQLNGHADVVHTNGQATENQLNGQPTGDLIDGQDLGLPPKPTATVTIWSIDWGQLKGDLRKNWKLKRSWQKILLLLIVFSGIVYDMVSDGLVANSFLNGQNYIKSVENQSDLAVTGSECSLISHTITNFTLEDRISESFRYVYFSKVLFLFR